MSVEYYFYLKNIHTHSVLAHEKIDKYNLFYSFIQSCNDWCERLAREQIDLLTTESIGFMNKYHVCIKLLNRDRGIYSCGRSKQSDCSFWPWFSQGGKNKHNKYAVHINGDFFYHSINNTIH